MEIIECSKEIPIDLKNDSIISIEREEPVELYGIGFQPAKCIPEIPRWFIKKYGKNGRDYKILEPFSGSGTTILEALKNDNMVYWMDNNPFAQLVCRCKSYKIDINLLEKTFGKIKKQYFNLDEEIEITTDFSNRDFWFQKSVQEALTFLKKGINSIKNDEIKDVLLLALSITVRKMSEMEDSMILASRRINNRDIKTYMREDVYENYEKNIKKIIKAYKEWKEQTNYSGVSLNLEPNDAKIIKKENFFNSIITSPPYVNAMDYVWASKFEMHWLDLVKSNEERLKVSNKEIGTERIPSKEYKELGITGIIELDKKLKEIYDGTKYKATKGQNELRSRVAYKYFVDMEEHFREAYKSLKKGGKYCFIIGDVSKICGVELPIADLLRDIAAKYGFKEIFRFHLLLKNRRLNIPRASYAGTIKYDTVIVLEK